MGKQSKKQKKILQQQQIALNCKTIVKSKEQNNSIVKENSETEDLSQQQYIDDLDLDITLKTIKKLGQRIDLLRSVKLKPLRAALHPLFEDKLKKEGATTITNNKNVSNCISSSIFDGRYDDSIQLLEEFARKKMPLKLGTAMRWVRDINVNTINPEKQSIRVLCAITKCYPEFQGEDYQTPSDKNFEIEEESKGELIRVGDFVPKELQNNIVPIENPYTKEDIEILLTEKGCDRKPPNQFDLDIFVTKQPMVLPSMKLNHRELPEIERKDVPWVPGAFVLNNVLSTEDCQHLVHMAETMGYKLDVPIGSETDFRAHGCVWLEDKGVNDFIFQRCKPKLNFLGCEANGLNARWRLYKYFPGNVYRPHIDGAWPGSGQKDGKYLFDAYGDRYSKLTVVIYLTEGFEGGCTTFYTPSPQYKGCVEARGVIPRIGSILFFPHGEQAGALIHEGSNVEAGGKYIIRTDLLYPKLE